MFDQIPAIKGVTVKTVVSYSRMVQLILCDENRMSWMLFYYDRIISQAKLLDWLSRIKLWQFIRTEIYAISSRSR